MGFRQRRLPPIRLAAGAALLAVPATAVALSAAQADAQNTTSLSVSSSHLPPGHRLAVSGKTSSTAAGQPIVLEYERAGSRSWQTIARGRISAAGSFRLVVPLWKSGHVRVAGAPPAGGAQAAAVSIPPSQPRGITVSSLLRLRAASAQLLSGQRLTVDGKLLPGVPGRWVRLEERAGGRWRTLTIARTGGRGGFALHYTTGATGQHALRVAFAGDRLNTRASHGAGAVTVFRQEVASWYQDGGATACGFHAGLGVASPYLPCGTRVTFRYGGRTVTATVDDRGPFVSGRDFDLNQNTAGALGFSGVDTVWATQ